MQNVYWTQVLTTADNPQGEGKKLMYRLVADSEDMAEKEVFYHVVEEFGWKYARNCTYKTVEYAVPDYVREI